MAKTIEMTEERVKIYAVNKKYKDKPFLVTAVTDNKTRSLLTGQEHLSQAELSKSELVIDPNDHYMIRNSDELVLRRDAKGKYELSRDYALYCLLQVVPEVASSRSEVVSGTHLFYMENLEKEAEKKLSTYKSQGLASAKIAELATLSDMIDMLFYFGESAVNVSSARAESKVYELAHTRSQEVLDYFNKKEESRRLVFIRKLLHYRIIVKQANGYLVYGDITLGANDNEAANFVFDNKNDKVFIPLKDQLDKATA
jgi:hypothetical protein